LVENYRQGDKVRQRLVVHMGRKELLLPHLDAVVRLLPADQPALDWVSSADVAAPQAWTWGPIVVAGYLWHALGLETILDHTSSCCGTANRCRSVSSR
jgi:hypothetical protein